MTKPITHRPLKKTGPARKPPPADDAFPGFEDAADRIRALAADGFTVQGVAQRLGTSRETMSRWLDERPDLREAFDQGRENERFALHNMLYRQAIEQGNATAAMFLLKARHGYREGDQSEHGNRVNVTITLPGAMTLQQFTAMAQPGRIIEGNPSDD